MKRIQQHQRVTTTVVDGKERTRVAIYDSISWRTDAVHQLLEAYGCRRQEGRATLPDILIPIDDWAPTLPATPPMDRAMAERFIETITGSKDTNLWWGFWRDADKGDGGHLRGSLGTLWADLVALNSSGYAISIIPNPGGVTDDRIRRVVGCWVDDDGAGDLDLAALPTRPSAVVETSPGRRHAYFLFARKVTEIGPWQQIQNGLAETWGTDRGMSTPAHTMRCPGFSSWKRGGPQLVKLVSVTDQRYDLVTADGQHQLQALGGQEKGLPPLITVSVTPTKRAPLHGQLIDGWLYAEAGDRTKEAARKYISKIPPTEKGTYIVACALTRRFGLADDDALHLLREWSATHYSERWKDSTLRTTIRSARRRAGPPQASGKRRSPLRLDAAECSSLGLEHDEVTVLQSILDHSPDGWDPEKCYATMATLAKATGFNKMKVKRLIDRAATTGLIGVERRPHPDGGIRRVSRYDLRPLLEELGLGRQVRAAAAQATPTQATQQAPIKGLPPLITVSVTAAPPLPAVPALAGPVQVDDAQLLSGMGLDPALFLPPRKAAS